MREISNRRFGVTFAALLAAVSFFGCRSDQYTQEKAVERARAFLLEESPELTVDLFREVHRTGAAGRRSDRLQRHGAGEPAGIQPAPDLPDLDDPGTGQTLYGVRRFLGADVELGADPPDPQEF